jgi:hypothetical protein
VTGPSPLQETGARPPSQHVHNDRPIGIREIRAPFGLGRTAAYERSHMSDDVLSGPGPGRIPPTVLGQSGART